MPRAHMKRGSTDSSRLGVLHAALVRACEAEARRWDEDVVALHHDTEDAKLDRFYKRLGYADEPAPTLPVDGFILKLVSKKILR